MYIQLQTYMVCAMRIQRLDNILKGFIQLALHSHIQYENGHFLYRITFILLYVTLFINPKSCCNISKYCLFIITNYQYSMFPSPSRQNFTMSIDNIFHFFHKVVKQIPYSALRILHYKMNLTLCHLLRPYTSSGKYKYETRALNNSYICENE